MPARTVPVGPLLGLNNRLADTRMVIPRGPSSPGGAWLKSALNVDMAANGYLRSRRGATLSQSGIFHSVWADDLDAYAVKDDTLIHIDVRTLAQTMVVPAVGNARVSFARLPDGGVYWTNNERIERLYGTMARVVLPVAPNPVPVASATAGSLPAGKYQVCFTLVTADGESPSTEPQQVDLPNGGGIAFTGLTAGMHVYATGPDGEVFNEIAPGDFLSLGNTGASCSTFMLSAMPPGKAIAHYKGSLLVARGRFLYVSEPYRYGLVNAGRAFIPFPADITVVQPMDEGFYVCADKTYWIPGDPLNTAPTVVLPFGGLRGSAVFDPEEQTAYWQSPLGVVVAKPGGAVQAPQDAALKFTGAATGATLVREQDGEKHVLAARFDVEPT